MAIIIHKQVAIQTIPSNARYNFGQNVVGSPASACNGNVTLIPNTTATKATDLQKTTSFFPVRAGSSTFMPVIPLKYPGYDGGDGKSGNTVSFGAFCQRWSPGTSVATAANEWALSLCGIDTRFTVGGEGRRQPTMACPDTLDLSYVRYEKILDAQDNTGKDYDITLPGGTFYPTGLWAERIGNGTWWAPLLLVKPQSKNFPFTGTTFSFRADCGCANNAATTGWGWVANTYRVVVAGFLNPAIPLVAVDVNCAAVEQVTTEPKFSNVNYEIPAGFNILGAYQVGINTGNYYGRAWGMVPSQTDAKKGTIITGLSQMVSGQTSANPNKLSAGDVMTRIVGFYQ